MAPNARRISRAAIITIALAVVIECFVLVSLYKFTSDNANWARWTVEKVMAGQHPQPDNNGPFDFRMFWSVGRMIHAGHALETYQSQALRDFEDRHLTISNPWINTPISMFAAMFAAIVGFVPGVLLWTASLTLGGILVLRLSRLPWLIILATLVSPTFIYTIYFGQINFLVDALFIASLMALDNDQVAAGVMMGLVVFKPQAGLLGPVVFLARRAYRSFAAAAMTVVLLILATIVLFSPQIWVSYVTNGLPVSHRIFVFLVPTYGNVWGESVFWSSRSVGFDLPTSYGIQILSALLAAVLCWRAWRDDQAERLPRIALTAFLALLVAPYYFTSDLCGYTIGLGLLAWHRGKIRPADIILWALPAFRVDLVPITHVNPTPVLIVIAAFRAHRMLHQSRVPWRMFRPIEKTAVSLG